MTERRWMLFVDVPERITASGARYGPANQVYDRVGVQDGRPRYEGSDPSDYIIWDPAIGGKWKIYNSDIARYSSSEAVPYPSDVVTWAVIGGSGADSPVPIVTIQSAISTQVQVKPSNTADVKYTWNRNMEDGQIFFRKKLASKLVFGGSGLRADFDWFLTLRKAGGCDPLYVEQQVRKGAAWKPVWKGRFSIMSMDFDLGRCLATVQPDPFDKYTCILDEYEALHNVLEVEAETLTAIIWPGNLDFTVRTSTSFFPFTAADFGYDLAATQSVSLPTYGSCGGAPMTLYLYWRERVVVDCLENSGAAPSPQGAGWVQPPLVGVDDITCLSSGTQAWARIPTVAWPLGVSPMVVGGAAGPGDPLTEPASPTCPTWLRVDTLSCVGGFRVGIYVCPADATLVVTYDTARLLQTAMDFLALKTRCKLSVASDFFEWQAPGDATDFVPGENYVTGLPNQVNFLYLIQKSDAIYADASNPAQKGVTSLLAMLRLLKTMFRVYWDVDDEGRIRIEHISYWATGYGLDLTQSAKYTEPLAFASTNPDIPAYERAVFAEALNEDFKGSDIVYNATCTSDTGKEHRAEVVTDLGYIANSPSDNKDGFVMVATDGNGSILVAVGALTGNIGTNTPLSWANIQDAFWRHDRYLPAGIMNKRETTFAGFLETIEQGGVTAICSDELAFNPRDGATGLLAARLGLPGGVITKAEWSDQTETLRLTLRYQFP